MSLNYISEENMDKMKKEAIDRANRANEKAHGQSKIDQEDSSENENTETIEDIKSNNDKINYRQENSPMNNLFKDKEELLIMILIVILISEDTEPELLFALIYLLL